MGELEYKVFIVKMSSLGVEQLQMSEEACFKNPF
jgi:hypothetical protein